MIPKEGKSLVDAFAYLTIRVNEDIVRKSNDPAAVNSRGTLDFIIWKSLVFCKRCKKPEEKNIFWAAYLMKGISQNQTFKEGNKRTSFVMAKLILMMHEKEEHRLFFDVPYEEAKKMILKISKKRLNDEYKIINWIKKHCSPLRKGKIGRDKASKAYAFISKICEIVVK